MELAESQLPGKLRLEAGRGGQTLGRLPDDKSST